MSSYLPKSNPANSSSRFLQFLTVPKGTRWPDLSVNPSGHEEHTAAFFQILDKVKSCIYNTETTSAQEAEILKFMADFTEFARIYVEYTAHIMESGKTLATKEDVKKMTAQIHGMILDYARTDLEPDNGWEDDSTGEK